MNSTPTFFRTETVEPPLPDNEQSNSSSDAREKTLFQRLENIASLSQVIRTFGACAIIASMSLFMLQGWAEGNDITRYLKLLAQTGLLTIAGLALSFLIKEFKGARVFFGLALVSVVANFTILGSLSYSILPLDMQIVDYPESMKWEVATGALFLPVFLGAVSLLSAVAFFGFSIFSRQIAKPLTFGLLGLSSLLLIPIRSPLISVGLSAIALFAAWQLIRMLLIPRLGNSEELVLTPETKASLCLLLLPGIIIIARAVSFYHIDDLALLAFNGLVFVCLRAIGNLISGSGVLKRLVEISQLSVSAYIAFMATQVLPIAWNSVDVLLGASIFVVFAFVQLLGNSDRVWKTLVVNLTTIAVVPLALFNATIDYELIYSIQALFICGLALAMSIRAGAILGKIPFSRIIAIVGIVAAALITLFDLIQLIQLGNWVIIGLCGAILIIGASLYERFGLKLLTK